MHIADCILKPQHGARLLEKLPFMNMVWFVQYDSADSWDYFTKRRRKKDKKMGTVKWNQIKQKQRKEIIR